MEELRATLFALTDKIHVMEINQCFLITLTTVGLEYRKGKVMSGSEAQENLLPKSKSSNLVKGILCMVGSAFSFALMGIFVHMAGDLHFLQKAFFRNLVALFIALIILAKDRKSVFIPKGSLKFLLLRSATGCLGIFGNFYALDRIPIADALMLNKMSPFFAVIFSFFFLHEKIKLLPLICTFGAFAGAMFVIKPSANILSSFPAIFAFIGGAGAGFAYTCVRKLGKMKITGSVIVAFFSLFSCLISVPHLIIGFEAMTAQQWLCLIGCGVAAAGGQFGITSAYYYAAAREVSIYDYSNVIFSAILAFIFFSQVPDALSFVGYAVIIAMAVVTFVYNKRSCKVGE